MSEPVDPHGSSAWPDYAGPPHYAPDERPWTLPTQRPAPMSYLDAPPGQDLSWEALRAQSRRKRPLRVIIWSVVAILVAAGTTALVIKLHHTDKVHSLAVPARFGRYVEAPASSRLTALMPSEFTDRGATVALYHLPLEPDSIELVAIPFASLKTPSAVSPTDMTAALLTALPAATPFPSADPDAALRCGQDLNATSPTVMCSWADPNTVGVVALTLRKVPLARAARLTDHLRTLVGH